MGVYTGRFELTRAKSGTYWKRIRAYGDLVINVNTHNLKVTGARLHGALEMDFGNFSR